MPLAPPVKELLVYLQKNPTLRRTIAAPPGMTVLYAGGFIQPAWKTLEDLKRTRPEFRTKTMLPDVLGAIRLTGAPHPTLLTWAKALDNLQPWRENGFIVWRALSGIFAANAVGAVSFYVGSDVSRSEKVFAATELPVLLRNPNIDTLTRDILSYYQRCIAQGQTAINLAFIAG